MKMFRNLVIMLTAASMVAMGCGGNSSTGGGGGGGFAASATGANAAVTSSNAGSVIGLALGQAFTVMGQGFSLGLKPVTPVGTGVVNGTTSGTATFDGSASSGASGSNISATVTFDDFSNGNGVWMQGLLTIDLTLGTTGISGTMTGDLNIAGDYQAEVSWDLTYTNSIPSGSFGVTSDGNTFTHTL